jgi:hypothetical protein
LEIVWENADMAMIELVDFNELYTGKRRKSKSRRGGKAKKADEATEAPVAEADTTQMLNSYECNCSKVDKLFVVYPFLFEQANFFLFVVAVLKS